MRIKDIVLHNFGSYVGDNSFDFTSHSPDERVIIIGGKNGAGKTTLFTAVQVCLYGHFAFGFKTAGKRYLREIYNLINNQTRIDEQETSFIEIRFQQVDNTDLFDYTIRRSWAWPQNHLQETLTVWQNGEQLDEDSLLNFQSYLIHLIPPDMLKLYFFDGEKIADYFLGEKEVNIRDALMVLSGNDTFDILYDQIKRVLRNSENAQSSIAKDYLSAKNAVSKLQQDIHLVQKEHESICGAIDELNAELSRQQKAYSDQGGITIEEWKGLNDQLKEEEEKRERLNWQRKSYATELLPFILVPDLMRRVLPQLDAEKEYQAYCALKSRLDESSLFAVLKDALHQIGSKESERDTKVLLQKIQGHFEDGMWDEFEPLFGLSSDEEAQVKTITHRVFDFDPHIFARYQKRINRSLSKSKQIRNKLQASSVENFESFMAERANLEGKVQGLQLKKERLDTLLEIRSEELEKRESELNQLKRSFEDELKAQSVSDLSSKALLLLEELQDSLYSNLIYQVEQDLNQKFGELIRKEDFFTRLVIDRNFVVHLLRNEDVSKSDLLSLLKSGNKNIATNVLGAFAIESLYKHYQVASVKDLYAMLLEEEKDTLILPIELDKERLSSGEKQIFVMSLYWALMNQSKNELPFIIDTPFARIDTEHRANITDHFFKKLTGQLLILSTDEELSSNHLKSMGNQISHIYMLEYGQDKKTYIYQNQYFEV